MLVYIGKYKDLITTRDIAKTILFWKDEDSEEVSALADILKYGSIQEKRPFSKFGSSDIEEPPTTKFYKVLNWLDSKRKRLVCVKLHDYDIYNLDCTIAHIVLPSLKKFKEELQSYPSIEREDLPSDFYKENEERDGLREWNYVLDEMIFAFDSLVNREWGEDDFDDERVDRGTLLFGKYYRSLWS